MSLRNLIRASGFILSLLPGFATAEQVVISEINYHPSPGKPEFIEFQNLTATVFDIAEWHFTSGVDYTFPKFNAATTDRTFLGKFERILVSAVDEATLRAAYPAIPAGVKIYGPWTGALDNSGETIRLNDKNGVRMAEVTYGDDGRKWPLSADGAGHSLRLVRPDYGSDNWRNWAASVVPGGTPGAADVDPAPGSPAGLIDLSEVHFSAAGKVDWVELRATSAAAVAATGLRLASTLDFSDGMPLTGTVSGGGYQSWDVSFSPDSNGDISVYLITANGTVLSAQKFNRRGDAAVESSQSDPRTGEWYAGPGSTRDAANVPSRNTGIVINEIMFDSLTDARNREYVELYNRGAAPVDLTGWSFVDGIKFDFPAGTVMAPGAYLVVAADPAFMAASYGGLKALGPFSGQLSDKGDLLRLEDNRRNLANQVDYLPGGDWPELAAGNGSSMELKHPDMDNTSPVSWADSEESTKAPFQTYTYTAPFQQVTWTPLTSGQELHMHLVGDGHLVVKNVSLRLNNTGSNLVLNPATQSTTYSSAAGWVFQGTHWASYVQAGEIHLIADGHGDNKANRGEVDITAPAVNQSYTLTFDARWVSGKPRLIMQTLDHGFGTSFALPVPVNPGTPGAANSRLLAAPAPALSNVIHSPAVPAAVQPVKITARVSRGGSATPVVEIVHRLDTAAGNGAWTRTPMYDDGVTGGDTVAGDGLYTGTLTPYSTQGQIAQFYVEASSGGVSTLMPRGGASRPGMFIKDSRVMPSTLLRERVIISQYDRNLLTATGNTAATGYDYPRMSNHYFNATLITNESEVRYAGGIRKSGSPFTRETGSTLGHSKYEYPGDRLFRGRSKTVVDPSGSPGSDTVRYYDDRIGRFFLYQLGHPVNEMEFAHWAVNGDAFGMRELQEPIANDFIDRIWEDGSKGTLLRVDDEWYFPDDASNDGSRTSRNADWSYKNSDNPIRYHSEWMMRSREADYDYSTFIEFLRAVGRNQFTEASINRLADRDMNCMIAAVRGYDADWDSLTMDRGKNGYFYRPPDGRWTLIHWDGDRVFDDANRAFLGGNPGIPTYFNQPYIRRYMNYYLTEMLNRFTKGSARTSAWMQAEKTAVGTSGVTMPDTFYQTWFTNRETNARNFIGAPLTAAFAITTSLPATTSPSISLSGTSPSSVYRVRVAGQPGAVVQWTSTTNWTLSGVALASGLNTITVEGVSQDGTVVQTKTFTTTKTGNSAPVMALESSPPSFNVSLSEPLTLDASGSSDPEGAPLTFTWATPPAGAQLQASGSAATASFQKPGLYPFTVSGDDGAGGVTSLTRQAAVYGPGGFSNFGTADLESSWKLKNVTTQDNFSGAAWYSLQTFPGTLHLHLPPATAFPLGTPQNPLPPATTYVDFGNTWAFNDANIELGTSFAQPAFDDSLWTSGPGLLGVDTNTFIVSPGIRTPLRRDADGGLVTYYLRTKFQFDRNPAGSRLTLDCYADDGARFFLNGQELGRVRLPAGEINKDTSGTALNPEATAAGNAVDLAAVNTDGTTSLVQGTNVLAVDLHNAGAGSSDVVFGAKLQIASYAAGAGSGLDSITHPWIKRNLPATGDWALQTDLQLGGIQFGNFMAGLLVEVVRDGSHFRYALGYRGGTEIAAVQITPGGLTGTLATQAYNLTSNIAVRLRREGDNLIFEWRPGTVFQEMQRVALPAGSTAVEGGPFASSESPETLDVQFDYVMLIDPVTAPPAARKLVLSELMYKPAGGDAYEYLELFNSGTAPINLTGYRFPAGQPFDEFIFPNVTIAPGAYLLVVHDLAAFRSRHGNALDPLIAGEWKTGNLSNSGETVTLLDAEGLVVLSFDYKDTAPWPAEPDTTGASLILKDPATGNTSDGASYAASGIAGGTPGRGETALGLFAAWMASRGETDPLATKAGEPLNNLLTYAQGLDLVGGKLSAVQTVMSTVTAGADHYLSYTYRRRMDDESVGYAIEWSGDGQAWASAAALVSPLSTTPAGDGTASVTVRLASTLSDKPRVLLRLRVTAP